MILKIRLLEPLHVGAKQVSGLDEIGADRALYLPTPSTALGALAAALGEVHSDDPFKALGCSSVWGPLVDIGGELYFLSENSLYAVGDVGKYLSAVRDLRGEEVLPRYKIRELAKPGVRLEEKSVRNLYDVRFTWLVDSGGRPVAPGEAVVLYFIDCKKAAEIKSTTRVGGEGRVAEVEVSKGTAPIKKCKEGVLLSPLLFYSEGPYATVGVAKGLEDVEEIYGMLSKGGPPKVKSMYVGLGFSMALRSRRAVYQALPPGTALRLRKEVSAVGLHSERGYGSLLCP